MLPTRTLLDQCVQGDAIKATKRTDHCEVKPNTQSTGAGQKFRNRRRRDRLCLRLSKVQIQGKDAQSYRAKGHKPEFDAVPREPFAKQRAYPDTDREGGEQEGRDRLVAIEDIERIGGYLDRHRGTEEPEPGNAENGQENAAFLAGELDDAPGFLPDVPVDLEFGIRRRSDRHLATRQETEHSDDHEARAEDCLFAQRKYGSDLIADGDTARYQSQDDRNIGAGFNERVAADKFIVSKLLRQVGILDRAEERRLKPHEEQDEQ